MIVIYGTRFYGEVDSHGGQRQLTKFFHVYYVPLVPVSTLWVTREVDDGYSGHPVQMSGRSVVAGYARVWGPLAAVGAFLAGSPGSVVAAATLVALCAWTWTWRSLRGAREQRRSDFHLLALGTRCDPLNMEEELAASLQPHVARRWAEVAEGNSPEDIARLGAANASQAVLAYASLRLAARLAPRDQIRKQSLDNSERIIDAIKETPVLEGGPYRATPQAALPDSTGIDDRPGAGR